MLVFRDHLTGFQSRLGARGRGLVRRRMRQRTLSFPGVLEREQGQALIGDWLDRVWAEP